MAQTLLSPLAVRRVPFVLLLVLFLADRLAAQTLELSLHDAISLAVRQNPVLAAAGARLRSAEAGIVAARGLDDFVFEASANWRDTRLDTLPGVPLQQRAFDEVLGAVSLTRPLATGGRLALQVQSGYGRVRSAADVGAMTVERWDTQGTVPSAQLSFEQPLLRGFGADVARADRRRASVQQDLAGAEQAGVAASLLRDVISGYWELAYSAEELSIRRTSAAAAREQLLRVQANIAVGKLPHSATAEIEVAIALRDNAVLLADQALAEQSLALGLSCGVPATQRLVARDPLPDAESVSAAARTTDELLETALAQNAALQAVKQQKRASAVEIRVTENGLLPQLDFAVAGGRLGTVIDPHVADQQVPGLAGYTITAGLALAFPIGRHAARGARDAARERLRKAQLDEAAVAAQVRAAVVRGIVQRDTARRRAEVLGPSARAAALDLEAEKARFEVGRATNFDVLRRQDQLALVQLLLLRARVDQLNAIAALDAVTGEILEQNDVETRGGER